MKKIEPEIAKELIRLEGIPGDIMERKRVTYYGYARKIEGNMGIIKDKMQIEINTFTHPIPYEEKQIQSYVGQFLNTIGKNELVKTNQIEPFKLLVLLRERTFFEKLLSLIRLSYSGIDSLKEKIRHFYDLCMLYKEADLGDELFMESNF